MPFTLDTLAQEILQPHGWWSIILRAALVYSFVLLAMRLSGKRQLGQMSPFDLVLLLLISNAVQNAMVGPDNSLTGGLIAAVTLVGCNWFTSVIVLKWPWFREMVEGSPTVLIHRGKVFWGNMRQENISDNELNQSLREHGLLHASEAYLAVLERDGNISVIRTKPGKSSDKGSEVIRSDESPNG